MMVGVVGADTCIYCVPVFVHYRQNKVCGQRFGAGKVMVLVGGFVLARGMAQVREKNVCRFVVTKEIDKTDEAIVLTLCPC